MGLAQLVHGGGGGGVAGHHQGLDVVLRTQVLGDLAAALAHKAVGFLAVGRMGVVGQVDKALVRQLAQQGLQHAQAANAAVKHTDGRDLHALRAGQGSRVGPPRAHQAAVRAMPLNSPLAMRCDHSAGPVMCALVPPASTATVTGMSTTSNS